MLSSEQHVREASSFSEEMGKAKDKLVPEQDETKSADVPF